MTIIQNKSGTFHLNQNGALVFFESLYKNWLYPYRHFELTIPEGVRELVPHIFAAQEITHLELPSSLERVARTAFSGAMIDEVVLPANPRDAVMRQLAHALRFAFTWESQKLTSSWKKEYADIYFGKSQPSHAWKRISNSSGDFYLDSDSVLMKFVPSYPADSLHIPEGVEAIPSNMFQNSCVPSVVTFPNSLRWLGCIVDGGLFSQQLFMHSRLSDVTLPSHLELFAPASFLGCHIQTLTISGALSNCSPSVSGRRFKDNHIEKIRVPLKFQDALMNVFNNRCCTFETEKDPVLGTMFCAVDKSASLGWGDEIERVMGEILYIEKKSADV